MPIAALSTVAGGVLSALPYLLIAQGALGALLFAYFSQLPLFAVGLGLGSVPAAVAGCVGILGVAVAMGIETGALFAASNAVPAALIVREALRKRPAGRSAGSSGGNAGGNGEWAGPGPLALWASGFGLAAFLAAAILLASYPGGMEGAIRSFLQQWAQQWTMQVVPEQGEELRAMLDARAADFPAFIINSWVLMLAVNAAAAQALLVRLGREIRPTPDYSALRLPDLLWVPLGLSGLLMVLGGETLGFYGRNLFAILAMPYFFQGLALLHVLARRTRQRTAALVVFYFLLLWFLWHAIFIVAVLGLIEQWAGLRRRQASPNAEDE